MLAPAIVAQRHWPVTNQSVAPDAPPCSTDAARRPNEPPGGAQLRARRGRAVLGVEHQRSTERIEAVHGIRAGDEGDARECRHRHEVPVDDVAEHLVDAHAIDEHRQALRRAEERRRGEAAVVHVGLQRIAGRGARGHARCAPLEEFRGRRRPASDRAVDAPKRCTLAGISDSGRSRPGRGVTPTTSTGGRRTIPWRILGAGRGGREQRRLRARHGTGRRADAPLSGSPHPTAKRRRRSHPGI